MLFDRDRITEAIFRAAREANRRDRGLAERVGARAVEGLERRGGVPAVEDIQDAVERALMQAGLYDVARCYVLYRRRRAELRDTKRMLGVRDELKLSLNAVAVLRERYLRRDERGEITESTGEMMERVARHVACAEDRYSPGLSQHWAAEFAGMLRELQFLPNSPTLMNAGTEMGLLSGCFVLPVEDSLESIFDALKQMALIHQAGDPGLVFLDRVNAQNPVPALGRIEATNPCGEVPLLPYESCNLGSVNLARMHSEGEPDWARLRATVRLGVRFLDDVIDVNRYPTPEVGRVSRQTRKIGLGVMGLAELLALAGIPYDSEEAVELGGRIAETIRNEAREASRQLARERGPFPAWDRSEPAARGETPQRNAQLVSIAPTGTISIIAGTTAGIEPMFAISYVRNVLGRRLTEANPFFERLARERGFYRDELMTEIARTGGVRDNGAVPEDVRRAFVTALETAPEWHLRMQAAFQEHADAAVSKTVNLPPDATVDDVLRIYLQAWHLRVKGITVYRYGSKPDQVLTFLSEDREGPRPPVGVDTEYAGGCSGRACEF